MNPTKVKSLYPQMAEQMGAPLNLIEDLGTFYWEQVRKELSSLPALRVHLSNLGDFKIKTWKLEKEAERTSQMLEAMNSRKSKHVQVIGDLSEKLTKLENLIELKKEEDQRKNFIHEHKKNKKSLQ